MATDVVRGTVRRTQRLVLMEILGDRGADPVLDARSLRSVMAMLGMPLTKTEFTEHLDYLSDPTKGFVRLDKSSVGDMRITLVALTPRGKDLLDGSICDPGVGDGCPKGD